MTDTHVTHPAKTGRDAPEPFEGARRVTAHLFRREEAGQFSLSTDRSGGNIPRGLNGKAWIYVRDVVLASGEDCETFTSDLALEELARLGYCLIGGWCDDR